MKQTRSLLALTTIWASASLVVAGPGCVNPTGRVRTNESSGFRGGPSPDRPSREWGPTVRQTDPPPPISGGTLLVTADGQTAVASDPDRDRVWVVDLGARALRGQIALERHDEPGRLVQDAAGRVHVALRRGGALVTLDPANASILARRAACPAPRGVAYDPAQDSVHVACAGGELVTLPAAGGEATRTLKLGRDLRDVVVDGDQLLISRFRAAELLVVRGGEVAATIRPEPLTSSPGGFNSTTSGPFEPAVAWRTVAYPGGGAAMLHQRASRSTVRIDPGGYGSSGRCSTGVVHATVTTMRADAPYATVSPALPNLVLAVDMAFSRDGSQFAVVAPGNAGMSDAVQLMVRRVDEYQATEQCAIRPVLTSQLRGQAVSVAHSSHGWVVQTREPAALLLPESSAVIALPGPSRHDTGHALFHGNTGATMACASCHPEGGDDGRTWEFDRIGQRRTQSLRGGLRGTEPFHWDGDMRDLTHLVGDVFGSRMSGGTLAQDQVEALAGWMDTIPRIAPSAPADNAAVERGRALFHDPTVACAACHTGDRLTNNATVSVGTGAAFQVPTLVNISWRAPFMHNGCAPTLLDRFGSCGGGDQHGRTSHLTGEQLNDLVAYLETL